MNGEEEVPGEFVVAGGKSPEVLEPAEASLNDIASLVSDFVEAMPPDAIGLVGDDWSGAALFDLGAEGIAIVALVGDDGLGLRSERPDIWRGGDVGFLASGQMECDGSAKRVTERRARTSCKTTWRAHKADLLTLLHSPKPDALPAYELPEPVPDCPF